MKLAHIESQLSNFGVGWQWKKMLDWFQESLLQTVIIDSFTPFRGARMNEKILVQYTRLLLILKKGGGIFRNDWHGEARRDYQTKLEKKYAKHKLQRHVSSVYCVSSQTLGNQAVAKFFGGIFSMTRNGNQNNHSDFKQPTIVRPISHTIAWRIGFGSSPPYSFLYHVMRKCYVQWSTC